MRRHGSTGSSPVRTVSQKDRKRLRKLDGMISILKSQIPINSMFSRKLWVKQTDRMLKLDRERMVLRLKMKGK